MLICWLFAIVLYYITLSNSYKFVNIKHKIRISKNNAVVRSLGSYERLLSRKSPNSDILALSHGCLVILDNKSLIDSNELLKGIKYVLSIHPMLTITIINNSYQTIDKPIDNIISNILNTTILDTNLDFNSFVREKFEYSLNNASFNINSPQWKLDYIQCSNRSNHAWLFTFNHGIGDQQSVNIIVNDLLSYLNSNISSSKAPTKSFPPSIEEAVSPESISLNTIKWAIYQLINSIQKPNVIPVNIMNKIENNLQYQNIIRNPSNRRTITRSFILNDDIMSKLKVISKTKNFTITQVLSAAMLIVNANLINSFNSNKRSGFTKLRFLLSVGLRSFVSKKYLSTIGVNNKPKDFTNETVACAAGAVDFNVDIPDKILSSENNYNNPIFWNIVKECKEKSIDLINTNTYIPESVRLFDFGMKYVDILKAVETDSVSLNTLGRGYTCSVSNVGLVNFSSKESNFNVKEIYYGTSQAQSGVLSQLSCMTLNNKFYGCLQFPFPIVTNEDANQFTYEIVSLLSNL